MRKRPLMPVVTSTVVPNTDALAPASSTRLVSVTTPSITPPAGGRGDWARAGRGVAATVAASTTARAHTIEEGRIPVILSPSRKNGQYGRPALCTSPCRSGIIH